MSSIILGAESIRLAGSDAQKAAWLPRLASGDAVATFAYAEGPGPVFATGAKLEGGKLSGSKFPVADAGIADIAVVLVAGSDLALVALDQPGVTRTKLDSFHQLRHHYPHDLSVEGAAAMPGGGQPHPRIPP